MREMDRVLLSKNLVAANLNEHIQYRYKMYFKDEVTDIEGEAGVIETKQTNLNNSERIFIVNFFGSKVAINGYKNILKGNKLVVPYSKMNPEIKVCNQFIISYKSIRESILNLLAMMSTEFVHEVLVTGYGQGAAYAQLCALDLQYNFPNYSPKIYCYTWGGCKVGNKHFKASFEKRVQKCIRITNSNDMVTKLPFFFCKHAGNELHIGKPKRWWKFNATDKDLGKYFYNFDKWIQNVSSIRIY